MKKISVIIPCYNVEHEIDRLMECLTGQTVGIKNLEIILVDDGSTDNTADKLAAWEKCYEENILILCCGQNNGMSYARNTALDISSGDYIAFVDADDWIAPNYIERLFEISEKYQSDIAICGHDRLSIFKKEKNKAVVNGKESVYRLEKTDAKKQFIASHIFTTAVWGRLYRRDIIEKYQIRFPEGVHYEDTFFCYMAYMYADTVSECTDVMYHYYRNISGTVIGDCEEEKRERFITLRMFYDNCVKNGWLGSFYDELEIIFIRKYYVEMLEVMFRTFEAVDYAVYLGMRDWLVKHFPNCQNNRYLTGEYSELDRIFLQCISKDFDAPKIELVRKAFLRTVYNREKPDIICRKTLRDLYYPQKELFFMQLDTLCENNNQENTGIMRELLFMVPFREDGGCIMDLADGGQSDRLPAEIYRYVIDREMFLSYLKDYIRRTPNDETSEKSTVCKEILGWFIRAEAK